MYSSAAEKSFVVRVCERHRASSRCKYVCIHGAVFLRFLVDKQKHNLHGIRTFANLRHRKRRTRARREKQQKVNSEQRLGCRSKRTAATVKFNARIICCFSMNVSCSSGPGDTSTALDFLRIANAFASYSNAAQNGRASRSNFSSWTAPRIAKL